ncbi:GRIP1-associated protein 1-like [Littorina saxatilis]|uniref:GRIP1-associated protein 1 n=1 Tax=Littorina saxatilis TaxID=31220 RepID=A0AAN9GCX8_9CAEN
MASALSEEEFHRMQLQLLELRTTNYELEGKCRKLEREVSDSASRIESKDKELAKANKAISKSKKAKETELLIQENDSFLRKLLSQEEEFRLQNQTLMTELSSLVADNEELKKRCEELEEGREKSPTYQREASPETEDQVLHLQAQNAALQKNLAASQEKYEKEVTGLRERLQLKSDVPGEKGRQSPAGSEDASEDRREVEGQADIDAQTTATDNSLAQSQKKLEELIEKVNDLQLNLDTEGEEKRLLKEQLKKSKEQMSSLEEEVEKLGEKLKKKQDSFLQLQTEKENLFEDSKKKTEELQAARDRDQKYYHDQISKLQQELEKAREAQESLKTSSDGYTHGLQRKVEELQKQVDTAGIVGSHQLQEQSHKFQQEVKELNTQLAALRQKNDDLAAQLQESQRAGQETIAQLQEAQKERDTQIQQLQEANKVAEKRKALLDELAIKYQKEYDAHRQQTMAAEEKHQEEVKALHDEIAKLEDRVAELSKTQPLLEELQNKVRSLEDTKGWLERRLTETEDQLKAARKELEETREDLQHQHHSEIQTLKEEHTSELLHMKEAHEEQIKEWEAKETKLQEESSNLQSTVSSLNQTIKDETGKKKIHEKKGMTMLKDLKRQLHAERKRGEKLQERLQEVLSESKNKSMEELFRPADPGDMCDQSSVSSWGTGASGLGKDSVASGPQSPSTPNMGNYSLSTPMSDPGDENAELLRRLTDVQEKKWALEEKVNHLETSNGCMAEDLLQKTAIIEHYVMNSHSAGGRRQSQPHSGDDKLTLKKVMDLVKNGDHGELQEMNRKLQLMLEETLTKNMHLQQNLETMSQELVRLSKLPVQNSAHSPQGSNNSPSNAPPESTTSNNSPSNAPHTNTPPESTTSTITLPQTVNHSSVSDENSGSHGDRPQSLPIATENGAGGDT